MRKEKGKYSSMVSECYELNFTYMLNVNRVAFY